MGKKKKTTYERFIKGKTKAGGQSAARFQRLRNEQMQTFYKEVTELINEKLEDIIDDVDIIIFGGNEIRAKNFLSAAKLDKRIRDKISDTIIPTSSSGEALKKIDKILPNHELVKEKIEWEKLIKHILKGNSNVVYGEKETFQMLNDKRVKTLYLLEDNMYSVITLDKFEVFYFSNKSAYGQQFAGIGGIAAILRW